MSAATFTINSPWAFVALLLVACVAVLVVAHIERRDG